MQFVDEEDGLPVVFEPAQQGMDALLQIAPVGRAGDQCGQVEREQPPAAQRRRHVALHQPLGQPFHQRAFPDAGRADQQRIVLAAAAEGADQPVGFAVASDGRIEPPFGSGPGQVGREGVGLLRRRGGLGGCFRSTLLLRGEGAEQRGDLDRRDGIHGQYAGGDEPFLTQEQKQQQTGVERRGIGQVTECRAQPFECGQQGFGGVRFRFAEGRVEPDAGGDLKQFPGADKPAQQPDGQVVRPVEQPQHGPVGQMTALLPGGQGSGGERLPERRSLSENHKLLFVVFS